MCTLILLRRPGTAWPLLLAANRDERLDRLADPPGPWWPGPGGPLLGGRDRLGGGTWMALGPGGVVAAVLNREGSLGPAPGKASRGALPLLAAAAADAAEGAGLLAGLDAAAFRPFNAVVADAGAAFFVAGLGVGAPVVAPLPEGLSMIATTQPNDPAHPRIARHLPGFRAAAPPAPPDWTTWEALLADGAGAAGEQLFIAPRAGFGTVSQSLLALGPAPAWRFRERGGAWAAVTLSSLAQPPGGGAAPSLL